MQFRLVTKFVDFNENEDEKYIYIIHFPKIDENVVILVTWKMVHMPLDTMWHLFNYQYL